MADPWLTPRSPLDDLSLPVGDKFALADVPPAARFVFRGAEAARAACSAAFGAALPKALGAAGAPASAPRSGSAPTNGC